MYYFDKSKPIKMTAVTQFTLLLLAYFSDCSQVTGHLLQIVLSLLPIIVARLLLILKLMNDILHLI